MSRIRSGASLGTSLMLAGAPAAAFLLVENMQVASATGSTITVDSTADGVANAGNCTDGVVGNCTLRDAAAAVTAAGDQIGFDPTVFVGPTTISLNQHMGIWVPFPATITGTGRANLTIDAAGNYSIFYLREYTQSGTTTIEGMTLTGASGHAIQTLVQAGGGELNVDDVVIRSNSGAIGAGVYATPNWSTTITGSVFVDNSGAIGGAVYSGGQLTVSGTTFEGNHASNYGGAVVCRSGGVAACDVFASTFNGNSASVSGGALYVGGTFSGHALVANSTFSGNSAPSGSAIQIRSSNEVTVLQSTVSGNNTTEISNYYTGAIHLSPVSPHPSLTITSSIVSGNTTRGQIADVAIGVQGSADFNASYSVLGEISPSLSNVNSHASTNVMTTNPLLGLLGDNGGPTWTMEPIAGSPAIGLAQMPVATFPGSLYDQRGQGYVRSFGTSADAGAFEIQPDPYSLPDPELPDPNVTTSVAVDPSAPKFTG